MAAVSHGTNSVTTKQHSKYTASVDIQNTLCKATVTHSELHVTRVQLVCSESENIKMINQLKVVKPQGNSSNSTAD